MWLSDLRAGWTDVQVKVDEELVDERASTGWEMMVNGWMEGEVGVRKDKWMGG